MAPTAYDYADEIADARNAADYYDDRPTRAEAEADFRLDCADLLFEVLAGRVTLVVPVYTPGAFDDDGEF